MERRNLIGFAIFLISGAILAFLAGVSVAVLDLPPTAVVRNVKNTAKELVRGPWYRDHRWMPRRYEGVGLVKHDPERSWAGITVMQGMFDEGIKARAYDADGTLLQEWPLDFLSIWPKPTHILPESRIPKGSKGYHTQGIALEKDGSILVNFAERGTARLGPCGDVIWTVDHMTHHSITENPDGTYWIPNKRDPATVAEEYRLPGASIEAILEADNYYADSALLIDTDGRVIEDVPILEPALDWLAQRQEFDIIYGLNEEDLDPIHLNDIEVVTPALSARLPGSEPGDLLLSMRNLNALTVLNKSSNKIVWMQHGPWVQQHDPDIAPDGTITVFDNGSGRRMPGRDFVGARVLRFDPVTSLAETIYPKTDDQRFFSFIMGTHQALPNDNILVTESMSGRVFEFTPDGEIVWEMVFVAGTRSAALIEEARRYPLGYVDRSVWSCP
ncbi:arylsulfotransferase family protein [Ruegeria sp. HKCCE4148]|uniref:arylsulfotransferase family protein n=1 Tax=Ruegeria sp. HKCCE4148 TaxID=2794829 RepID=UPI001AE8B10D|nr:arylsulfotransferase family protein [Ruegeria sp. HKCCE4148]